MKKSKRIDYDLCGFVGAVIVVAVMALYANHIVAMEVGSHFTNW